MEFKIDSRTYEIIFTDVSIDLYEIKIVQDKDSKNYGNQRKELLGYFQSFESIYQVLLKHNLSKRNRKIQSFEDLIETVKSVERKFKAIMKLG